MMQPTTKIILAIIGFMVIGFVFYQVGVSLGTEAVLAMFGFLAFGGAMLYFLQNSRRNETGLDRARTYARTWWRDTMKEHLSREQESGSEGYFGQTKMYAFRFQRHENRQWIIMVVKASGGQMSMYRYNESPTPEEINDPFKIIDNEYLLSPVPLDQPHARFEKWMRPAGRPSTEVNIHQPRDEFDKMKKE